MRSVLRPLYWVVWASPQRRARKLLQFAQVEADGGRDLVRAAELTQDPVLRRRFFAHARDEAVIRAVALHALPEERQRAGNRAPVHLVHGYRSLPR